MEADVLTDLLRRLANAGIGDRNGLSAVWVQRGVVGQRLGGRAALRAVYPKGERAVRDLPRRRSSLVQQHTANLLAVQYLFSCNRGRASSANEVRRLTPEVVAERVPDANLARAIQSTVLAMRGQQAAIDLLEREAWRQTKDPRTWRPLLSVNGIGRVLGLTIMLETGPIERFAHVGNDASDCRCVGSTHVSNGTHKGKGSTKNGNQYLAWAYVAAANFAVRCNPQIKRDDQRKRAQTNGVVAIKAVAHKLARACYHSLRDGSAFDVNRAFA